MSAPDTSSAEWIAEAPSTCDQTTTDCQPLPLTDFGTVSFTNASATANGHTGTISDSAWGSAAVQLSGGASSLPGGGQFASTDSSGGATPSALSSNGSSFSVAYSAAATSSDVYTGAGDGYGSGGYGGYGYGYGGGGYGYAPGENSFTLARAIYEITHYDGSSFSSARSTL